MTDSVNLLKKIVALKPGGEVREQQQTAVAEIESSLLTGTNLLLEAPTGSGKALKLSTPILTVNGWSTMGELVEGDVIYGKKGTTVVTKAHDAFFSKKMFRLKFSNGEEIFADSDHLWNIEPFGKGHELPSLPVLAVSPERLEELNSKTLHLTLNGVSTLLSEVKPVSIYPQNVILTAYASSDIVEEDDTNVTVVGTAFLEKLYQQILGAETTWRTEDMAKVYDDPANTAVFSVQRNQPLVFSDVNHKLPAPTRMFGEWLSGADSVFTEEQKDALQEMGVISSNQVPEAYMKSSVAQRHQLLLGIFNGEESGELHTTSQALADDVQELIAVQGRSSNRTHYFEDQKLVELVTLNPIEDDSELIISIEQVESAMVRCITVDSEDHLFLAGRTLIPTHNTLSYLIPVVEAGTRAVISTATKQLSEQIMGDIDFLNDSLKKMKNSKRANATLLKGRDNYLCLAKFDEILRLEDTSNTLFSTEEIQSGNSNLSARANKLVSETKMMSDWANETESGDRTQAPATSDETWRQYSSSNAECPGRSACPFGQECFAEVARDKAREAPIVITNHAVTALDLDAEGQLLGDREVFIFDELHELDNYMSSAWGAELTYRKLDNTYKLIKAIPSLDEKLVADLKLLIDGYDKALRTVEKGLIDNEDSSTQLENYVIKLANVMTKLTANIVKKEKESGTEALKRIYTKAKKVSMELLSIAETLSKTDAETVRWTVDSTPWKPEVKKVSAAARRGKATSAIKENSSNMSMQAAPLRIGPKLQIKLAEREAIMIGLSATVTVMGRTDIPVHNFGLDKKPHKVVVLDTPFDYKKQAMLYIPDVNTFPVPVGATRQEHAAAFKEGSTKLIGAAGGRSLILSTTSKGVEDYSEHYRKKLPKIDFLAQGDAPNSQLVSTFKSEELTCLTGTMGFWHGLDAPGKTLSLVVIDKIPFPTPDDPLLLARKNYADKHERNGFMEIYVTIADWMLRQGFGRAIRSKSDRAVVAIYDTRLISKNYGRAILQNFHGVGLYHDEEKVISAIKRLVA